MPGLILLAGGGVIAVWKFSDNFRQMFDGAARDTAASQPSPDDARGKQDAAKGGGRTSADKSESSSSGIPGPLGHAQTVIRKGNEAKDELLLNKMRQAIRMFEGEHERPPKNLAELSQVYPDLPKAPSGREFIYDARTGRIDIVPVEKQPAPPAKPG